jgi:hypothetical protein
VHYFITSLQKRDDEPVIPGAGGSRQSVLIRKSTVRGAAASRWLISRRLPASRARG